MLPERMEMLEYKVDKVLRYLEAFCPKLNIDSSTIAGLNDPPLCIALHLLVFAPFHPLAWVSHLLPYPTLILIHQ